MSEMALLLGAGLVGGLLAGLLGIGGGIIYVVILQQIIPSHGIPESLQIQFILANSMFGVFAASLVGSLTHMYYRQFYWKPVLFVAAASLITSLLLLRFYVNTPLYNKPVFLSLLIVLLIYMIIRLWSRKKDEEETMQPPASFRPAYLFSGLLGGSVAALTGLGGGVVVVPSLKLLCNQSIKVAKSISLGMISFASLAITVSNVTDTPFHEVEAAHWGYLLLPVSIPLSLGVVLGAPLGVRLSQKISGRHIALLFIFFILAVLIRQSYLLGAYFELWP